MRTKGIKYFIRDYFVLLV